MEVSPKTFREVEFREKMRGYHPEDVDQFLEQMAAGVEVLQERLRQAVERAQRAEAAAADAGGNDETLRRTLVLAQRTADMAVQEAREQAARIVSASEQQAKAIVADAEERARRMHNEALGDVHAELAKLETVRAQSQQEVDTLNRWAEQHRTHLTTTLADALAMLERGGLLTPAPSSTPIEVPAPPRSTGGREPSRPETAGEARAPEADGRHLPPVPERNDTRPPAPAAPAARPPAPADVSRPPAAADVSRPPAPADAAHPPAAAAADAGAADATQAMPAAPARANGGADSLDFGDETDEAMGNFFADADADIDDDRRFGGRLRRRR